MGMFRLFLIHLVCFYLKVYCVLGNIFRLFVIHTVCFVSKIEYVLE